MYLTYTITPIIIILRRYHILYLTYTICSHYHTTLKEAYCALTYTICSHYHNTTEEAYCKLYLYNMLCGSTKCSPTQYAHFSSILCTLHTQYAPLEHFVYPAYTICYQWSILCRVDTYVISVVVRRYTICSSWKHVSWYLPFFLTVLSTSICLSYEPYI